MVTSTLHLLIYIKMETMNYSNIQTIIECTDATDF